MQSVERLSAERAAWAGGGGTGFAATTSASRTSTGPRRVAIVTASDVAGDQVAEGVLRAVAVVRPDHQAVPDRGVVQHPERTGPRDRRLLVRVLTRPA